ncbi:MAG: hypothetical protein KC620_22855 [Myxococcales bacterium]|nr:hypothetical protein [Myxococcales bacterium]
MDGNSLLINFCVSLVGFGMFRYGRSARRSPALIGGIVMMAFPYFITGVAAMLGLAALICTATFVASRFVQ